LRGRLRRLYASFTRPVIANIYLHHVLDIWFTFISESKYGSGASIIRYADDAVFTFRNLAQAKQFQELLKKRLEEYGISLNEAKTKALISGQREAARHKRLGLKMPTFTFLGFLHVWGTARNRTRGNIFWRVKRRTCPKRFKKKLSEIKADIRKNRHEKNLIARMKRVTTGYLNYFAINDNNKRAAQFVNEVKWMLFKYRNRRGQQRSYDWPTFTRILRKEKFPEPHIRHHLFFNLKSSSTCR